MIENKLSEKSKDLLKSFYYKLPYTDKVVLQLLLLSYGDISCLNTTQLSKYNDKVKSLTFNCKNTTPTVNIDNSNREEWEKNHPECLNRKQWERITLKICYNYSIDIQVTPIETLCDVTFEIVKNTISCDVLTTISLQQKLCDLNISVNRSKEECASDYKILIEKYQDCNISKKEYLKLIDNNFSFEIISLIYKNNLKLEVDSKGNVSLISPIRKYKIPDELKLNDVIYSNKNLIHKVLDDYNISKNIKENILNELKQI